MTAEEQYAALVDGYKKAKFDNVLDLEYYTNLVPFFYWNFWILGAG